MRNTEFLETLLWQSDEEAPHRDCCQNEKLAPALSRSNSLASSCDEPTVASTFVSSDECESLSWANLPFVVRHEKHPSAIGWAASSPQDDEEAEELLLESEIETEDEEGIEDHPCLEQQPLKLTVSHSKLVPASFGWGDFPLVQAPSFDYPWKYHIVEDEQIVPLSHLHHHHHHSSHPRKAAATEQEAAAVTSTRQRHEANQRPDGRSVTFSQVRIREYTECLGNHPWCPQYPVSLDWRYSEQETVLRVDEYEEARCTCCWSSMPRRMDVLERRSRLAKAMRISPAELDVMERHRQEAAQREEDGAADAAQGQAAPAVPSSVHRVPTMIVLPEDRERAFGSSLSLTISNAVLESQTS